MKHTLLAAGNDGGDRDRLPDDRRRIDGGIFRQHLEREAEGSRHALFTAETLQQQHILAEVRGHPDRTIILRERRHRRPRKFGATACYVVAAAGSAAVSV